jgi:hypothetical protein
VQVLEDVRWSAILQHVSNAERAIGGTTLVPFFLVKRVGGSETALPAVLFFTLGSNVCAFQEVDHHLLAGEKLM